MDEKNGGLETTDRMSASELLMTTLITHLVWSLNNTYSTVFSGLQIIWQVIYN